MNKRILVVDLEATCWEGEPPQDEVSEVIEVGYAVLDQAPDERWELTDSYGILIKPTKSTVSQYCTDLTGITHKAVEDSSYTLQDAMDIIEDVKPYVWGSWGEYDWKMLNRARDWYGIKYTLPYGHLNIKVLYSAKYAKKGTGMGRALKQLGMVFDGVPHRGEDDAKNAAQILRLILNGEC
jgi:inhibitor of KinA sporulation pathway (predicted exonuclease)